jgi:hypothetical protein
VGPELKDFSNGLGSRWCFAVERAGDALRKGFAGGRVAVAACEMGERMVSMCAI